LGDQPAPATAIAEEGCDHCRAERPTYRHRIIPADCRVGGIHKRSCGSLARIDRVVVGSASNVAGSTRLATSSPREETRNQSTSIDYFCPRHAVAQTVCRPTRCCLPTFAQTVDARGCNAVGRRYGRQLATFRLSRALSTRESAGQSAYALVAQGIEHRFPKQSSGGCGVRVRAARSRPVRAPRGDRPPSCYPVRLRDEASGDTLAAHIHIYGALRHTKRRSCHRDIGS
jgi:hypothetical protein